MLGAVERGCFLYMLAISVSYVEHLSQGKSIRWGNKCPTFKPFYIHHSNPPAHERIDCPFTSELRVEI